MFEKRLAHAFKALAKNGHTSAIADHITSTGHNIKWDNFDILATGKPGGVLPYMGYIGMCGPKGYGFSAVLVINWVSILAILPPFWS